VTCRYRVTSVKGKASSHRTLRAAKVAAKKRGASHILKVCKTGQEIVARCTKGHCKKA